MKNTIDFFHRRINKVLQIIVENKTFIFLLIFISILYALPLILANTYYVDDLNRTVAGYNWNHDGRYISSVIMHILSFQSDVVFSLYPFSMMIGSVLLSLSGLIVIYSLGVRNKTILFVGSLLLTTCPFLLEILAYRFDSIPISLSVLFITLPFLFFDNRKHFFIASVLGIFLSLGLYQTTAMSYCIIICLFLIKDVWNEQYKKGLFTILWSAIAFLVAFFIYKVVLDFLDLELLQDRRGDFIFKDANLFQLLKDRYHGMIDLVKLLFKSSYKSVFLILLVLNTISLVIYFRTNAKTIVNKQLPLKLLFIVLIIFCVAIFTAGVNMFVYEPRWVPRAMIGWGFAIYLLFFPLLLNKNYRNLILSFALIPFVFYSFLLSSQLGIYLKNQDDFSDYIINLVSPKLLEHDRIKVIIKGTNKTAHRNITVNYNTMPIIYKLAPIYENNDWGWGIIRLNKFDNISSIYIGGEERNEILKNIAEYPIADRNIYYTLRIKGDIAIIDFERGEE